MGILTTQKRIRSISQLWLLYIIWPLGAFLLSLKNYRSGNYRFIIILFFTFYGFTFIPIVNSDGDQYSIYFKEFQTKSSFDYWNEITHIYSSDSSRPDIYASTLLFLTSRMSSDVRVFFMFAAFIYALVFLKLIDTIVSIVNPIYKKYYFVFFLGVVFVMNFSSGVNGIRFALALMFFSTFALKLIITGRTKYLPIAFLSVLIHFSLLLSCFFLIAYYFLKNNKSNILLLSILVIAVIFTSLFSDFIHTYIDVLGQGFEKKYEVYTQDFYIEERIEHVENWNWYIKFNMYSTYYFSIVILILTRIGKLKLSHTTLSLRLYLFAMLLVVQSIISGDIVDPISNRYYLLVNLFAMVYFLYISSLNPHNKFLKIVSRFYLPIFILHALIIFRSDLYTVSPVLIFGNWIVSFFYQADISIQELLLGPAA